MSKLQLVHSGFVRTDTGRVLGWGANDYRVPLVGACAPNEDESTPFLTVRLLNTGRRFDLGGIVILTISVLTDLTVERVEGTGLEALSCGNGQYGGLSNTNAQLSTY